MSTKTTRKTMTTATFQPGDAVAIAAGFKTRKGSSSKLAGAVGIVLGTSADGFVRVQVGIYATDVPADKLLRTTDEPPRNSINHRYGIRTEAERALVLSCDGAARISTGAVREICTGGYEAMRSTRPGAEDHRKHPSLVGGQRVWLDGRREAV